MIRLAEFDDVQVQDLLRIHLHGMHENSPIEHSFALDLTALQHPKLAFLPFGNKMNF